ncbi:phage antirepressor KilAC domain-containing protein [Nostoc sp. FACHB-87]|uniref:phage antirepressor KilAC domain-containing protein n=1 Tax=Nostocaceae TaxID=1162 RepID=UPI0016867744|nr:MULTISPECIES: phage antirepressor KilAC domain-containing protein [Nostocaceae]MBD2457988.1 phage antirepressor KilAC domain-containing protein [Nostoc sp. FACHB-87]MBD2479235.1 phage antirepressor KilAC domain-containing protein [Anabaena sp. FACHB-83]
MYTDSLARSAQFTQTLANQIYQSAEQFPVSFDDAWVWLGYSRKDNAKLNFSKCQFIEGIDYIVLLKSQENPYGGRPAEDIYLAAECLKRWAMRAGTTQGEQVRSYFLECERVAKAAISQPQPQLPGNFIEALEFLLASEKQKLALSAKVEEQEAEIAVLTPKAEIHDLLIEAADKTFDLSSAAKLMGFKDLGQKRLFSLLRDLDILMWNNTPFQQYMESGYFVVKESHSWDGRHISLQPRLTQKGLSWLTRKLINLGYEQREASA